MSLNLKELSNSSTQLNGAVTFFMFPYSTLAGDPILQAFEELEPRFEYVHDRTGECSNEMPDQYRKDVERARAVGADEIASHWKARALWGNYQVGFITFERFTTALEFREGEMNARLRALQMYWLARELDIAARWDLFQKIISPEIVAVIDAAYKETRDTAFAAPEALQTAGATDEEKKATSKPNSRSSAKSKA